MKNAPCARFGMRIRPKISENPDDNRNSRPPKATLFSVWMIQNCHCIDGPRRMGQVCAASSDALPLPWGEGWGEGLKSVDRSEPPHPDPLPSGEREHTESAIR